MISEAKTLRHMPDTAQKMRKVALLETMVRDFASTAANLAREIVAEEERTRIKDPNDVAYSTLAKALALRRGKLLMSAGDAEMWLLATRCELGEATAMASREDEKAIAGGSMVEVGRRGEGEQGGDQASHAA